jgi:biopolymer transport protein ExbD
MILGRKKKKSGLILFDLTPMIDAVFNLIIFFLVTLSLVKTSEIILPRTEIYEEEKNTDVVIYLKPAEVGPDGQIKTPGEMEVNYDPVTWDTLKAKLRQLKTKTLVIKADQKVFYQTISKVMDIGKKAGVESFTIATTGETTGVGSGRMYE